MKLFGYPYLLCLSIALSLSMQQAVAQEESNNTQPAELAVRVVHPKKITPLVPFRHITEEDEEETTGASSHKIPIGIQASTLGWGLHIGYAINNYFNIRLYGNQYSGELEVQVPLGEETDESVKSLITTDFSSYLFFLDYHIFQGSFHITLGAVNNRNKISIESKFEAGDKIHIGSATLELTNAGKVETIIEFDKFTGYAGIGFGNFAIGSSFTMGLDLGVIFQGEAIIKQEVTGFGAMLEGVKEKSKESVKLLRALLPSYYPVVQLNMSYTFGD